MDDDLLRDPAFNGSKRKDAKRLQERVRLAAVLTPEERAAQAAERARADQERGRIGEALADEWERLNRTTFPAHDPDAMAEMHAFLRRMLEEDRGRFQRKGNLLFSLVRLGNAIDHPQAGWYVGTWLLAAVAQADYALAESLMTTIYEHPEVSLLVTSNKPETLALLPLSRALIALKRDGDWAAALEHARDARRTCGFDPRAVATCQAIEGAHAEVAAYLADTGGDHERFLLEAARAFDITPLTTRSLDWTPPERQLGGDATEPLCLEHDDDPDA